MISPLWLSFLSGNAAAGVIGALAWEGLRRAYVFGQKQLFEVRTVRGLWSFASSPTHVFIPLSDPSGRGAAGGYGDLLALTEMVSLLDRLNGSHQNLLVHPAQGDPAPFWSENAVVIGGGKYNKAYRRFIDALQPPFHFFDTATQSNDLIRNAEGTKLYSPRTDSAGTVRWDIGICLSAPNPHASDKQVVIAAGSHTYGSAAAMRYMTDPKSAGIFGRRNQRTMVVVGCEVSGHRIGEVKRQSEIFTW